MGDDWANIDEIRRQENAFNERCRQLGIHPTQYQPWLHDPWPPAQPTNQQTPPPGFPIHTLPAWVANQAANISATTQTPQDLAIICQLGALSTIAMWKQARIRLLGTWHEPANLYLLAVLNSGEGKSPAMKQALTPLHELFQTELDQWDRAAGERHAYLTSARGKLDQAERDLKKHPNDPVLLAEVSEAKTVLDQLEQQNMRPQPVANDITPEAMIDALTANGERLAILDTEPGIFDLASRYAGKDTPPNITLALKAHSGDPVELRRRGTGTASLKNPHITLLVMAQPVAVNRVYADQEMRERGLAARLLVAEPNSLIGTRQQGEIHTDGSEQAWATGIRAMWERCDNRTIQLDQRATQTLTAHFEQLEQRLDRYDGDLRHVAAFISKLKSSIGRIALLLHWADGHQIGTVNNDQTQRAIEIGDYFLEHHLRRVGPADDDSIPALDETAEWLRSRAGQIVTASDIRRGQRLLRDARVGDLIEVIDQLELLGWLRASDTGWEDRLGARGMHAPRFAVNPNVTRRERSQGDTLSPWRDKEVPKGPKETPDLWITHPKGTKGDTLPVDNSSQRDQSPREHKTYLNDPSSSTESDTQPLSVEKQAKVDDSGQTPRDFGAFGPLETQTVTDNHTEWPKPENPYGLY